MKEKGIKNILCVPFFFFFFYIFCILIAFQCSDPLNNTSIKGYTPPKKKNRIKKK